MQAPLWWKNIGARSFLIDLMMFRWINTVVGHRIRTLQSIFAWPFSMIGLINFYYYIIEVSYSFRIKCCHISNNNCKRHLHSMVFTFSSSNRLCNVPMPLRAGRRAFPRFPNGLSYMYICIWATNHLAHRLPLRRGRTNAGNREIQQETPEPPGEIYRWR